MSRLDYVTIAIIIVCVAALAILIWKTVSLRNQQNETAQQNAGNTLQDYDEYDYYEDTTQILPPTDEDLDDNEVEVYNENKPDDEPVPAEAKSEAVPSQPKAGEDQPVTTVRGGGEYLVLAGSFKIKNNAENEARRLRNMGYGNASAELFNRGAYAVVMVDRFDSASDAQNLVKELKSKGVEAYVQHKRAN